MDAAREQEAVGLQPGGLDPLLHGVTGSWRDLGLDYDGPGGDLVAVADVAELKCDEVAPPQLAVDARLKSASSRTRPSICRRTSA
jgi:hypothetical protein